MLKNYLTVAWRTLRRDKVYTTVNVLGLAVGMAAFLIIGLYASEELSHDDFHARADRIMAVVAESRGDFARKGQFAPRPLGDALEASVPEVRQVVRTRGGGTELTVRRASGGTFARKERVLVADAAFFDVFSFPLVQGDPSAVLDAPQRAVITQRMARAFFGSTNPVGQALSIDWGGEARAFTVAGVAPNPPATSSIQFDVVVPSEGGPGSWNRADSHTYALLNRPMDARAFTEKVQQVVAAHDSPILATYAALPLSKLYLSDYYEAPGFTGQRRYVQLFSAIALLILLVAAINSVNLVTAQGERRAKEVGVRKTAGARREQLAAQFLGETAFLGVLALVAALALVGAVLPGFNALLGTELSLAAARSGWALPALAAFVLAVSVTAGAYPAFVLSRFRPVEVLRGRGGGTSGRWLQRGLVVFQFAVSAGLILCTAVILRQVHFVQTKSLGFDGEQVVSIELPFRLEEARHRAVKRAVLAVPGVERATASGSVPGGFNVGNTTTPQKISSAAASTDTISIRPSEVDADYLETMGMELLAGRGFRTDRPTDRTQGYVLNRAAARAMGWTPQTAIGKPFEFERRPDAPAGSVLGVVENFHIESLRDPVKPVVLLMESQMFSSSPTLSARLAPGQVGLALDGIKEVMTAHFPEETFDYTFLDDKFDAMYRAETRLAQVFAVFAGVAVLVACLGLFGLAAFAAERRKREIAIRKAMGASTRSIVGLVSKEFALLVLVALAVGPPVAYWGVQRWLSAFAYRIEVGPWMFALTAAVALLIAGGSAGYHALRAALANPAQALRDE